MILLLVPCQAITVAFCSLSQVPAMLLLQLHSGAMRMKQCLAGTRNSNALYRHKFHDNVLVLISDYCCSLQLPGEITAYSFLLGDSSVVSLLTGTNDEYIVFRYGLPDSIFLEFPQNTDQSSWYDFSYSSYGRMGGELNEGMEFFPGDTLVEVYDNYYSPGSDYTTGIVFTAGEEVIHQESGVFDTRIGSLNQFLQSIHSREVH